MPINVISPTGVEQLLEVLRPTYQLWRDNPGAWVFRGQRDATWHLIPTAFRPDTDMSFEYHNIRGMSLNKRHQFEDELNLLLQFVKMADSLALKIPGDSYLIRTDKGRQEIEISFNNNGWPPDELLELLAIAQHHGVPTRLLDFSKNAMKAAFFAAESAYHHYQTNNSSKDDFCIWALNTDALMNKVPVPYRRLKIVTVPHVENEYLHCQEGLFLYDCCANDEWDKTSFSLNLDEMLLILQENIRKPPISIREDIIHKITFPISESKLFLRELNLENINKATLMPNYDNAVSALRFNRSIFHKQLIR